MNDKAWVLIDEVRESLQADILGGLLEANGFNVFLSQEGANRAIGVSLGPVQILVPSDQAREAAELLRAYYSGELKAGGETT